MSTPEMPEALCKEYAEMFKWINENTITQSLLYDLDLLPEQIKKGTREWYNMVVIAQHLKASFDAGKKATDEEITKLRAENEALRAERWNPHRQAEAIAHEAELAKLRVIVAELCVQLGCNVDGLPKELAKRKRLWSELKQARKEGA